MKKFFHLLILSLLLIGTMLFVCACTNSSKKGNIEPTQISTEPPEFFTNYIVSSESVNIRSKPNIDSKIIDTYYKNTLISTCQTNNKYWNKVKISDSDFGYVHTNYISLISVDEYNKYKPFQIKDKSKKYGIISTETANIRSLPDTKAGEIIAIFNQGDALELLATTENDWYLIEYNDITCYISPEVLTVMSEEEYNSYITLPTKSDTDETQRTLIGSYSTDYSFSSYNREYNLEKASLEMNSLVILPGATFNWCRDMGPCGKDEGYLESNEIVDDQYVVGYGGGICQLSSTLCAALINSDGEFEFIERNRHSLEQSYIPSDLDATVSYPTCNFIFQNCNDYSIMIETVCNEYNQLTVNIYKIN